MQFHEQDVAHLLQACDYYKSAHPVVGTEYDRLIHKVESYRSEMECADCNYVKCEIHELARP